MIEVDHLTKDYGTVVAVRDLSFHVGRGEVVGFLGPNGAGKSTTLRILAGWLGATAGRVTIDGHDIATDSLSARRKLGYMPEAAPSYGELRVREYLTFRAELKQVPRRQRVAAVGRALELGSLTEVADTLIRHLSKGFRQRVGLADALVANPPLLILDEPTAGLDPNQIREVRRVVRQLAAEHTILLSTHILPEVESVCSRAVVIARGRLVAAGSLEEVRALRHASTLTLAVRGAGVAATLTGVEGVARVEALAEAGRFRVEPALGADPEVLTPRIVAALVGAGLAVLEVQRDKASLEEVFAQLTSREPGDVAGGELAASGSDVAGGELAASGSDVAGSPAADESPSSRDGAA